MILCPIRVADAPCIRMDVWIRAPQTALHPIVIPRSGCIDNNFYTQLYIRMRTLIKISVRIWKLAVLSGSMREFLSIPSAEVGHFTYRDRKFTCSYGATYIMQGHIMCFVTFNSGYKNKLIIAQLRNDSGVNPARNSV